jgi:hypothetical protein
MATNYEQVTILPSSAIRAEPKRKFARRRPSILICQSWNFISYRSNYPMKKKFLVALLILVIVIGVVWAKPELLRDLQNWTRSIDGDPMPSLISNQGRK